MPLVTKYSQSQDQRWRTHNQTADGVCFALSVQFIICKAKNESFDSWLAPSGSNTSTDASNLSTIITRMAEQAARIKKSPDAAAKVKYDYVVELVEKGTPLKPKPGEFGISFEILPKILYRRGETAEKWGDDLSKDKGVKYISISGSLGDRPFQHGIAASTDGSKWSIFDPNVGLYIADTKSAFAQDLRDLFEVQYTFHQASLAIHEAFFTTFS